LLGAVFIELLRRRRRHQATWKRGMWSRLAIVIVAQLVYGAIYPIIDQWAHAVGLITGVVLGVALSPGTRWSTATGAVAGAIAAGFAIASLVAGWFVVQTSFAETLTGGPATRRQVVGEVALTVPASWGASATEVFQPDGLAVVTLGRQPRAAPAPQIATWIAEQGRRARSDFGELTLAHAPTVALPAGWEGSELVAELEDSLGYRQRMRIILCGRAFGDAMIFTMVQVPETIARGAPEVFAQLLASIGRA